jgi:predicted nucleic acid-binding protein
LTFVDANILIDIASNSKRWADWSRKSLAAARKRGPLLINVAIYAEFAIGFDTQSEYDLELAQFDLTYSELTKPSAFRAAQGYRLSRRRRIDLRIGAALDTLPILAAEGGPPFDFVFIDAEKTNNPAYFSWALRLTRSGSGIVVDNVVRGGAVADLESRDPDVRGVREFFDMLATEARVSATALQAFGNEGLGRPGDRARELSALTPAPGWWRGYERGDSASSAEDQRSRGQITRVAKSGLPLNR